MNDRDTFAAAALTGIIAAADDSEIKLDQALFVSKQAWLVADAMLAARGTTDLDAAPAATASEAEKQAVGRRAETSAGEAGTGDTRAAQEPVAWGIYCGDRLVNATLQRSTVDGWAKAFPEDGYRGVPLYAAPPAAGVTLTDAERCELEAAASDYEIGAEKIVYRSHPYRRRAATLRGLLARATKEGTR
jgi:hypothetical protein